MVGGCGVVAAVELSERSRALTEARNSSRREQIAYASGGGKWGSLGGGGGTTNACKETIMVN